MYRFYLTAVDTIPAAIVLIPLFLTLHWTVYRGNKRKSMLYCLFTLYLAAVFAVVGIPNITYIRIDFNCNWIPFRDMLAGFTGSILNILLFVPIGFLLPVLWGDFRKRWRTIAYGFTISLLIEILQIFTYRATDINDLMTNTFGTFLGFLMAEYLIKRGIAIRQEVKAQGIADLCGLSIATFLVMFVIHPFLSKFIWDRIL